MKVRRFLSRVWRGDATPTQAKDTGMAVVLVLLLLWLAWRNDIYVVTAVVAHVLSMAIPQIWRPVAVIWFGFSHILGMVVSKVVLTIIFLLVVTPIGVCRRLAGSDSLKLKAFKKGRGSVMNARNYRFTGSDLERPY
jgi:hypothetical protein